VAYASDVDGKLFIDATNNIGAAATNAAAAVARAAPNARHVRAFNTLGWENFANPTFDGVAADHFFSAPSADRDAIERLISDVGLRPAYLGPDKQGPRRQRPAAVAHPRPAAGPATPCLPDAHQPPTPTRSGIEAAFVFPWWPFRRCVHCTAG
jgi:hypothetical protein